MNCPPPEHLLDFAAGQLGDDRAVAIESHIDVCAECRAVLSNLARSDARPSFGRYRIDTVLSAGGMGIVYRGWDPQLARPIAIKVVRRGGSDGSIRERLVREAQSLAKLSHPNVCHVYDVGTEGEEVWVAMELIDGLTLRQWADERRAQKDVLDALLGAAEGIAAAHAAGIIHRDVKPENVMMTRDGRAIVTDFGLARADDVIDPRGSTAAVDPAGPPPNPNLTETGAILGTPAYLAPEQMTGEAVDARIDQFTWGVMAWELLTGVRPFPVAFASRLDAIRVGVTPPPTMPRHIAAALARAMAVAPRDRFASMRELIEAVRAPSPVTKPRKWGVTISTGLVVVLAGMGVAVWQGTRGDRQVAQTQAQSMPTPSPSPTVIATAPQPNPTAIATPTEAPPSPTKTRPSPTEAPPNPRSPQTAISKTSSPRPQNTKRATSAYLRNTAIASLVAFCHLPYDAAHPDPALWKPIADWGKVVQERPLPGRFRGADITVDLIEVKGQRKTYRFPNEFPTPFGDVAVLDVRPGDMVAFCPEDDDGNIYHVALGPLDLVRDAVPISAPPRIVELAKYRPLYLDTTAFAAASARGKMTFPTDRRLLIWAVVGAADGNRFKMDYFWLEVPPGVQGSKLVSACGSWSKTRSSRISPTTRNASSCGPSRRSTRCFHNLYDSLRPHGGSRLVPSPR
ncbi:MAG TPA: protein kinase [Kofleriaceae bacterium]|nr:protein kinase [Kofleriaceae bacterium]